MKLKLGATQDGRMVAGEMTVAFEAGAFPGSPVNFIVAYGFANYNVPHQKVLGYDVVVNKPKTSSYRAPGATQVYFAMEQLVDELATKFEMDPIDFRLLNVLKEGDRNIQDVSMPRLGGEAVLNAMKNHPHYSAPLEGPNTGRGVALGFKSGGGGLSWCTLAVSPDGSISMATGSPDMSGTRLTTAMQAAETLGIPVDLFDSQVGTSADGGNSGGTWGSRVTFATGIAAIEAAKDLLEKMRVRAAQIWNTNVTEVNYDDGQFINQTNLGQTMTFKELAGQLNASGGPLVGEASLNVPTGGGPPFAGHIIDVAVDPATGKVDILRCTIVQDVGRAIHPDFVEGQLQGGTVQGIGWALNEGYFYDKAGHLANKSLLDYRLPVSLDLPPIDCVIIEVPNPAHPFGVKSVGESSITTPPAAIANAIQRAVGVRMDLLPMSPGNVWDAIANNAATKS
jgi:CO/xanthine dehydrogenase Mo-binding subunit